MKKKIASLLVGAFLFGILAIIGTGDVEAIPAWSRKYDMTCSRCHYPAVPRLNSDGQRFRRAGYRFPDEFKKPQDNKEVGEYISMRGRFRYSYTDPEFGVEDSEFQFHDATFFYSGAITANFSAFFEVETEPESGANETTILAQVSALLGNPDRFWTFRIGQFHTFTRVGFGGFDRPSGISTPAIFNNKLTSINPFKLKEDQRGLEVAYVNKDIRILGQVLNGVDVNGDGNEGSGPSDTDKEKDSALAFEWILDDRASGLTALIYHGRIDDPTGALMLPTSNGLTFNRYALTANKVFGGGWDIMGGFVLSEDKPNGSEPDVDGEAYFFTLEKFFESTQQTFFGRYDFVDVDTDIDNTDETRITLGWVFPFQEHIRFAVEYANVDKESAIPGSP